MIGQALEVKILEKKMMHDKRPFLLRALTALFTGSDYKKLPAGVSVKVQLKFSNKTMVGKGDAMVNESGNMYHVLDVTPDNNGHIWVVAMNVNTHQYKLKLTAGETWIIFSNAFNNQK